MWLSKDSITLYCEHFQALDQSNNEDIASNESHFGKGGQKDESNGDGESEDLDHKQAAPSGASVETETQEIDVSR